MGSAAYSHKTQSQRVLPHRGLPSTAAALMAGNQGTPHRVYCEQRHKSSACTAVTSMEARKDVLQRSGRCYVCLRKHHLSRDCRSQNVCNQCRGRHHISICPRKASETSSNQSSTPQGLTVRPQVPSVLTPGNTQGATNNLYVDAQTPVLLQTAKLQLHNLDPNLSTSYHVTIRGILDSGSQRTYVRSRVKEILHLTAVRAESLHIKTFGSVNGLDTSCDVVEFGLGTSDGKSLTVTALVVPFICNPLTFQPISQCGESYAHLAGLDLADSADMLDLLEVDVLIGCDLY